MSAKIIKFGKLPIYRSICMICGSFIEYDARDAEIFNDMATYGVSCPACGYYNEFKPDMRVQSGEIALTSILPRFI